MPLYEYECRKCHHRFEVIQNLADKPIRKCPKCRKGTVQKLLSSPALRFKGSGFYITDYPRKGSGEGTAGGSGGEPAGKDVGAGAETEKKLDKERGKPGSGKKAAKKD